jgi:CTP:molybdopterin cytidylyltransferase MocA
VCSDGRVTHSALAHARCLAALDVLVIAGGLGTRIQSALGDTPKLLAPIGGRPYLAYLLDWLRRFGAKRIVLGLGHRAQAVIDFLDRQKSSYDDLTVVGVTNRSAPRVPSASPGRICAPIRCW